MANAFQVTLKQWRSITHLPNPTQMTNQQISPRESKSYAITCLYRPSYNHHVGSDQHTMTCHQFNCLQINHCGPLAGFNRLPNSNVGGLRSLLCYAALVLLLNRCDYFEGMVMSWWQMVIDFIANWTSWFQSLPWSALVLCCPSTFFG